MKEWVSVKDRLPEHPEFVLVVTEDNYRKIGWSFFNSEGKFCTNNGFYENVTHWMFLPPLPEGR